MCPCRVFLAGQDYDRLSPEAKKHLPKAADAGHAVLRVLTAEGDFAQPPNVSLGELRSFTRTEGTKSYSPLGWQTHFTQCTID